jgi:hypothetical protein
METENSGLSPQARTYFLVQGQSIGRLYEILNSNILIHHLRKWFSVCIEISLYLSFIIILLCMVFVRSDIRYYIDLQQYGEVEISYWNNYFEPAVLLIKMVVFLLSIPLLLFAILLGRNRKKNNLMHQAFVEVKKMKEGFDGAVKELKL